MDVQELASILPNNFHDLPSPYHQTKAQLIGNILQGNLDSFYGLTPKDATYRVYHATVDTKLPDIAREGLKAFFEQNRDTPRIFVTPSPTLALWHAIHNKPHDTLRRAGVLPGNVADGKPVLLQLRLAKDWLAQQRDLAKSLDPVEFMRLLGDEEAIGVRKPEQLTRLQTFHDILGIEVDALKKGIEATNLGIPLPVDQIPPEFIYVDTYSSAIPIREWLEARK